MQVQELRNKLFEAVTADEWERLEHGDPSLVISSFNREVLLSMRNTPADNGELDTKSVCNLQEALQRYLDIYMADCSAGHKWIMIASIYLTFVKKRPMHPQQAVHWKCMAVSGKEEYICPCKDTEANSVCSCCVCHSAAGSHDIFPVSCE